MAADTGRYSAVSHVVPDAGVETTLLLQRSFEKASAVPQINMPKIVLPKPQAPQVIETKATGLIRSSNSSASNVKVRIKYSDSTAPATIVSEPKTLAHRARFTSHWVKE